MALGAPTSFFLEVEFTAGVWTDIVSWVRWDAGLTTRFGRSTLYSAPSPSTLSVTLDNSDGRFTVLRQTLKDGSLHPYWPNLRPKVRVRAGYTTTGPKIYRFFGYVSGWPPSFDSTFARVQLAGEDRMRWLATQPPLDSPYLVEVKTDAPLNYWPMSGEDDQFEYDGIGPFPGSPYLAADPYFASGFAAFQRGATGPSGNVARVTSFPAATGTKQYFKNPGPRSLPFGPSTMTLETSVSGAVSANIVRLYLSDSTGAASGTVYVNANASGQLVGGLSIGGTTYEVTATATAAFLATWYHAVVTLTSGGTLRFYVDGVLVGSVAIPALTMSVFDIAIGVNASTANADLSVGPVAVYSSVLSAARVAVHNSALRDWAGEALHTRATRLLTLAGVPAGDITAETSTVTLGWSPQDGQDPVAAVQALNDTEGNGSVFYVEPDGELRFTSRNRRRPGAPVAVLDAVKDLDGDTWDGAFDVERLVNQVKGTHQGTTVEFTVLDQPSIDTYGSATGADFTDYADDLYETLWNAQQRIAAGRSPGFRLDKVVVDLWTAETPGLYEALGAARIGDRIRIVNLPATAAPAGQLDLIIEGFGDDVGNGKYKISFDTSPADMPAEAVFDDTDYGRFQANGQTLTSAITASATSLSVTSPAADPTFTTDPAMYPLTIVIGAEHIELNNAPSGAASPQSFTGVTRGVDGTTAAAQTAASLIDLFPTSTWTL